MTYIEIIAGFLVLSFFIIGFSQAAYPALESWQTASEEYQTSRDILFISESFRKECSSPDKNIENWKKVVSIINELETYEISELTANGIVCALRMVFYIKNERIEVVAECVP